MELHSNAKQNRWSTEKQVPHVSSHVTNKKKTEQANGAIKE